MEDWRHGAVSLRARYSLVIGDFVSLVHVVPPTQLVLDGGERVGEYYRSAILRSRLPAGDDGRQQACVKSVAGSDMTISTMACSNPRPYQVRASRPDERQVSTRNRQSEFACSDSSSIQRLPSCYEYDYLYRPVYSLHRAPNCGRTWEALA